jgi:hypothetical protein
MVNDTGHLRTFWDELCVHVRSFRKEPFLIAHQNGFPTICLLKPETAKLFALTLDHAVASLHRFDCWVILFDCFLREAKVPPRRTVINPAVRRLRVGI